MEAKKQGLMRSSFVAHSYVNQLLSIVGIWKQKWETKTPQDVYHVWDVLNPHFPEAELNVRPLRIKNHKEKLKNII